DVFISSGDSSFFNTVFRYVLPLGEGLENPGGACALQDGFVIGRDACGGGTPILSGSTSIGLKTFYEYSSFENWQNSSVWENEDLTSAPKWETNGLRFFLTHDNTDFNLNPSRGYYFELQYSKDFDWGDSTQNWDFLEFKYNHYFSLDSFSFTKQNILALSVWTGYSFSWDNDREITPGLNAHRPPIWEGARLGGYSRMRGYDKDRFSDKAVSYATAEYRTILKYNPLKNNDFIPATVDWFQLVGFVEVGRVHDQYNFDLLSEMKYDIGVSLRAMIEGIPVRLEVATGDEGANVWLMVNQPFDF
ncbi:BamA/TamA family outer membrane protein, partial [Campylobacterota bacterium]